jgi:ribosomal protein S27AE
LLALRRRRAALRRALAVCLAAPWLTGCPRCALPLGARVLQKESTLHLVLRLRGGAKKRKKKTYTKPKKNKHKRRKVKLAYLQFYKVDGDNKVTRLRKECPNAECGAGVFMANHFDRHYCGKCGLTYVYSKEEAEKEAGGKGKGKGKK